MPPSSITRNAPVAAPEPFRAAHSDGFPDLLRSLGVSLLVTTDQAGKLVVVREQGGGLNTHFRTLQAPMGLALTPEADRLAVGTSFQFSEVVRGGLRGTS